MTRILSLQNRPRVWWRSIDSCGSRTSRTMRTAHALRAKPISCSLKKAILNVTVRSRKRAPAAFKKPSKRCETVWLRCLKIGKLPKRSWHQQTVPKETRRRKEAKLWVPLHPQCMPWVPKLLIFLNRLRGYWTVSMWTARQWDTK